MTNASKRDKGHQRTRIRSAKKAAAIETPAIGGARVELIWAAHFDALLVGFWEDE